MAKYRKKPVVIEAVQWNQCAKRTAFPDWFWDVFAFRPELMDAEKLTLTIPTLEGDMVAQDGDWIIRGVKGELYPCKPDIFEATYELVDDCLQTKQIVALIHETDAALDAILPDEPSENAGQLGGQP